MLTKIVRSKGTTTLPSVTFTFIILLTSSLHATQLKWNPSNDASVQHIHGGKIKTEIRNKYSLQFYLTSPYCPISLVKSHQKHHEEYPKCSCGDTVSYSCRCIPLSDNTSDLEEPLQIVDLAQ